MSFFRTLIILAVCLAAGGSAAATRPEMVRVALIKGAETLKIDGSGLLLTDGNGWPVRSALPLEVRRSGNGVSVNGVTVNRLIASAGSRITVNGKGYRGLLEVSPAGGRGLLVVNELPLEDYLVGLINCEISSAWPIEAIKAQAVVARSYAVYQMLARRDAPYQLESSVMDQVYAGADVEDSRAAYGVRETAGEVLTYDGKIIQAFYHSNCAGHTESSKNVWGLAIPYLQGVPCRYCEAHPARWELDLPLAKVETALRGAGYPVSGLKGLRVRTRNQSGRVQDLSVLCAKGTVVVPAVAFRKAMGYGTVKSTDFELDCGRDQVRVTGAGSGHGVGLCQWGAKGRADEGFDYREILSYYYPGVRLVDGYGR